MARNAKLREFSRLKEQLQNDVLRTFGTEELDTSPILSMIVEFNLPPELKYCNFDFAKLLKDNFSAVSFLVVFF